MKSDRRFRVIMMIRMKYQLRLSTLIITAILLSAALYAAPATLTQPVMYNSETITLRLTKQNLRGPHFELWAQNAGGGYDVMTPVEERAYIGTVDEYSGAIASGILQDDGQFRGAVYFDRGGTWWTLGTSVIDTRALTQPTTYNYPSYTVSAGHGGTTTYRFDVGVDADYDYYSSRAGGSVAKAFEMIEYSVATTRALYMQNVLLRPYLGRVIIRTSQVQDPADGLTGNAYLNALRTEWQANQTDADRDVVSGVTKSDVGGGLGWVATIGGSLGYSVNDSDATGNYGVIWRHELGHNWGMNHFDGGTTAFKPEGVTINSGNQYARMSGPEAEKALNERDAKLADLNNELTYTAVNIPPYASLDAVTFTHVVDTQINIDVMANDHDANGDALSILSFDAISAQGGSMTQSGSGSSATLVYSPPSDDYLGPDWFYYEIQDASGQTATGVVTVNVDVDNTLRGYWPMDESSGTALDDASVFDHAGTAKNGVITGGAGRFGNAVTLDGSDDHVEVYNLTLNTNDVTMTAWIKRNGTQSDYSAIVMNNTSDSRAGGLNFSTGNQLGYHWNESNYSWKSGLVPADGQWVFAALVVEPSKATIYMYDGSLQSAVHTTAHTAKVFTAETYIGTYPGFAAGSRHYKGSIDDVRIYSRALTQAEILDLVDGGGAECLRPFDGQEGVPATSDLQWSPGAAAVDYDVYLGTDYDAVRNATPGSPEYQDTVSGTTYAPTLLPAKFYYWRIDTNISGRTITGKVCSFLTGNLTVLLNTCDFESGFGNWINVSYDSDYDWIRNRGPTPTALTGPSGGADGSTWYAYMETSPGEGASNAGDTVILESPNLDADAYSMRLNFYYHMYGVDIGTLNVDVYDGAWHEGVWSRTGQQQGASDAAYESAQLDLTSYSGIIKVRFRVVAAGNWRGDIAIDNITITGMAIPQLISECDFEGGFGNWINVSDDGDYDWIRNSGPTPTATTGPSGAADGTS